MTEQNGKIVCDLNGITRLQLRAWRIGREKLVETLGQPGFFDDNREQLDEYDWKHVHQHIITQWPYGHITWETYTNLGMVDAQAVDDAVTKCLETIFKKK